MAEELLEAAKTGDLMKVKYLVSEVGLAVDSRNPPEGPTSLYWAACNGYVHVCSWLIKNNANVNFALPKSGSTPLHAAADRGHRECVLLLLCSGAHINKLTSNNRDTPLHLAAYRGFSSVCSLLIDHGADVFILNKQCRTALDEAYVTGHVDIVQMICKKHTELANIQQFSSKSTSKRPDDVLSYLSDPIKELSKTEGAAKEFSYHSIDLDDRIGITQFDKGKSGSFKTGVPHSSTQSVRVTSQQPSFGSTEKHEISRTFASFHSSLMEQLERLTNSVDEKDRQLMQLRKENDKLKAELKKFTHQ